jgi:hypothetical protein
MRSRSLLHFLEIEKDRRDAAFIGIGLAANP